MTHHVTWFDNVLVIWYFEIFWGCQSFSLLDLIWWYFWVLFLNYFSWSGLSTQTASLPGWQVLSEVLCEMFCEMFWCNLSKVIVGNCNKYVASKDWTPWTNVSKMCRCSAITLTDLLLRRDVRCMFFFWGLWHPPHTQSIRLSSSCLPSFYEVSEFWWILRMPKAETLEDAHVIQALAKVEQQWGALADCAWRVWSLVLLFWRLGHSIMHGKSKYWSELCKCRIMMIVYSTVRISLVSEHSTHVWSFLQCDGGTFRQSRTGTIEKHIVPLRW